MIAACSTKQGTLERNAREAVDSTRLVLWSTADVQSTTFFDFVSTKCTPERKNIELRQNMRIQYLIPSVNQSSLKSSRRNSASSSVGSNPFPNNHRQSRNHYFVLLCPAQCGLETTVAVLEVTALRMTEGHRRLFSPSRSDTDSLRYLVFTVLVTLETEHLCKFVLVSLVMFGPGEQYTSDALQTKSSSAYSSSTEER